MQQTVFTIISQENIASRVYRMRLQGDTSGITAPGQFVNIRLEGKFLRRPISVCDVEGDILVIVYKVVGTGTEQMSRLQPGMPLDILTGLGNGYDLTRAGERPLLIGGGVGVPPMYKLAKELCKMQKKVRVVLGFNTAAEVMLTDEFRALGCDVEVMTMDGSLGKKGLVTDALGSDYTYFYTCGPLPMLRALYTATRTDGEMSFEERMGCGFGVCVGCTLETKNGFKRVCKDGPVFRKEEVIL